MYFRSRAATPLGRPSQPASQVVTIPASTGGVNALDPAVSAPAQDCFYTFNLMPSEYGLRLRKGYREWATGVGTGPNDDVRGIIPFEGTDPANNKLFASCQGGIYDVTTEGDTSPSLVQAFGTTTGASGYVTWCEFTTDANETYLFVADPENGLFQYQESTGLWTVPSFTGGVTVADIAFVGVHKQRIWFVEKNSASAWYSGIASIAGALTEFTFGSKFKYGGDLIGIYTWTLDGGDGVDDYLVAVSRGGDVLAYRGSDPAQVDWTLTGSYFIGQVPASRRITVPYAGELFILSTFGVTSLRDLVSGVDSTDMGRSPSAKINRILRQAVIDGKDDPGWQMTSNPADGFLQIVQPWANENEAIQYNQNLLTKAWGYWQNVPEICADTWEAEFYIGSTDGRVFIYDGSLDNTTLSTAGSAIQFSILTSYQPYGNHGMYKQAGIMRVVAVAEDGASFNLKAIYDYNINPTVQAAPGSGDDLAGIWDIGLWDNAIWSGEVNGISALEGAAGIGRTIAMAMRGESISRLTVVGWDVTVVGGGFL